MKVTILQPTRHDGKRYNAGEVLEIDRTQAKALIDASAAEPHDPKAAAKATAAAKAEAEAVAAAEALAAAEAAAKQKAADA